MLMATVTTTTTTNTTTTTESSVHSKPTNKQKREKHRNSTRFYGVTSERLSQVRGRNLRGVFYSPNQPAEHHVGWIMDYREHRPHTYSSG